MMNKPDAQKLLDKYKTGTCTEEELAILETWYKDLAIVSASDISERDMEADLKAVYAQLPVQEPGRTVLWPKIAIAAAMVTIVFGAGLFYYNKDISNNQTAQIASTADIAPGKQGATLTLANGKQIRLSDALNGELSKEAGVTISKTQDGQLIYEIASIPHNDGAGSSSGGTEGSKGVGMTNVLSTAKGETYQVKLPDGTVVWLNAASTLKYTANLLEYGKRKVSLQGEAFFKVAKDKAHPFVVKTGSQEVEVLGTQFNINSYSAQAGTKTTLLEGSVRLVYNAQEKVLTPNQQATTGQGTIAVKDIDAEFAVAWKNGFFMFDSERLEDIMDKLSRWYDVQVEFTDPALKDMTFFGTVSRSENISKVLKALERTKSVTFSIENNKVFIKKK